MTRAWSALQALDDPEPVTEPAPAADVRLHQVRASLLSLAQDGGMRDLTLREFGVLLVTLEGAIRPTVRGIAAHLAVATPVISQALDVLEALQLMRRKDDPLDRRSVLVEATTLGQALADRASAAASGMALSCRGA